MLEALSLLEYDVSSLTEAAVEGHFLIMILPVVVGGCSLGLFVVVAVATTVAFAVSVAAVAKVLLFPLVGHSAVVHLFVAISFSADNNNT